MTSRQNVDLDSIVDAGESSLFESDVYEMNKTNFKIQIVNSAESTPVQFSGLSFKSSLSQQNLELQKVLKQN